MKKPYFPMFIDISEKKIVVIGGGNIAGRRVGTLQKFSGQIQVVAPEICEEMQSFLKEGKIRWEKAVYSPEVIDGADIVLAATDDAACNEAIVRECRKRGILVNTAHKKELCDFYFPAIAMKEEIVAGITTSGMSHKRARQARESLECALEDMINKQKG